MLISDGFSPIARAERAFCFWQHSSRSEFYFFSTVVCMVVARLRGLRLDFARVDKFWMQILNEYEYHSEVNPASPAQPSPCPFASSSPATIECIENGRKKS